MGLSGWPKGGRSSGYEGTVSKIASKVNRAREFAAVAFSDEQHRFEIWSPVVPKGGA